MFVRTSLLVAAVLAAAFPAGASAHHRSPGPDVAVEWNQATLDLLATPGVQPITVHPTRTLALVSVAMRDAVDVVDDDYPKASAEAAAAAAAHGVLVTLYPAQRAGLDARFAAVGTSLPERVGVAVGEFVAADVVARAADDGTAGPVPGLPPGTAPGEWRPTPPAFGAALYTHYPNVRPFVLRSASQFRSAPPPAKYAAAIEEVRALGAVDSTVRTAAQTDTARFWSSPIHIYWSGVAARVALYRDLSLSRAAELVALMNVTLADTTIAYYDSKYVYKLWRPVTAIREGGDTAWTPLVNTPSDPSYPGAHSALSAAGAEVLEEFFGRDIPIVVRSPAGAERSYRAASDAADEAGVARLWGGVHYPFDDPAGQKLGRSVGRYVAARLD